MKNRGFTLIELLVVVAIIGILAAVGVVAYSGYTSGAKKSATKSNHNGIVKYIMNESMKCSLGETNAMGGELDCTKQSQADWKDVVAKATIMPSILISHPFPLIIDLSNFGLFQAWLDQALFCS